MAPDSRELCWVDASTVQSYTGIKYFSLFFFDYFYQVFISFDGLLIEARLLSLNLWY